MTDDRKLLRDTIHAVKLWRISWFLGAQDIKARFRRSFMGPLWILVNLALWVGGVGLVYGLMFGQTPGEFVPGLMAGFVVWGFLASTLTESGTAFLNAQGYIKQFSFPKQIHILRAFIAYNIVFAIGMVSLLVVLAVLGRFETMGVLRSLPGIALLLLAGLGHIAICAYLGTRFRDLPHAMAGILQVAFLMTPIVFPVEKLRERNLDFIYQFNPLYYMIDVVRHPLIETAWALPESYLFAALYVVVVWLTAALVTVRLDSRVVFLL